MKIREIPLPSEGRSGLSEIELKFELKNKKQRISELINEYSGTHRPPESEHRFIFKQET